MEIKTDIKVSKVKVLVKKAETEINIILKNLEKDTGCIVEPQIDYDNNNDRYKNEIKLGVTIK